MALKRNHTIDIHTPLYLDEMLGAIDKIFQYTEGHSLASFVAQSVVCDAVQHQFEILGEATTHIAHALKNKRKQIPWAMMYSLRNHIAHEYFDVDYEILWEIIQHDLKDNRNQLLAFKQEVEQSISSQG